MITYTYITKQKQQEIKKKRTKREYNKVINKTLAGFVFSNFFPFFWCLSICVTNNTYVCM